ncbi:helix-turn-helix domain-containing protein [Vibrio rumoiensis]|uniref:Transcriptional regulator n=1 Tax=Vibrio rumoiensis 1S-45 TaxID=1188252 RepID=A0A1E5E4G9_9VIBR|nr:helix-turn-helix domain-containing protein [Vibrio rumoiensis]OEF27729.1 transcriptional regulator [Vibrio rumoiensis 1S-45]
MKTIEDIAQLLIKQRKDLGMEQSDMLMRIGMKQQQYQRIEAGSDIRLSTLLRVLEGLNLELSITPKGHKPTENADVTLGEKPENGDLVDDTDDLDFWFKSE